MGVNETFDFIQVANSILISLIGVALGVVIILIAIFYIIDVTQTKQAVRRNFPVIGRFRYLFEYMGEFFRNYFFAMDREEMPFNRAQRSWVYRAAKNVSTQLAFGSTRDITAPGTILFGNCPFPTLEVEAANPGEVIVGPYCKYPYKTASFFNISGLSFGAISEPAVRALSNGAAAAGCWLNTGEGGLTSYHLEGGCDIVFQMGTAKYGVRDFEGNLSDQKLEELSAHEQVKMIEIKLSQGAKPGKGGILPGEKVTAEIASIRGIPEGQDSISPNRHPDINNIDQLLRMIDRIRRVTGKPVGIKCVIGDYDWLDDLFSAVNDRGIESAPDFVTIDSGDGGTGAAPMALLDYVGLPVRESLPTAVDTLKRHGLKGRIKVISSGKLITPEEVAWALCAGADFVVSGRGFMFALGCIQALQCDKNTCPTGVTTHNKRLQKGLDPNDKAERVKNYIKTMRKEVGTIAHSCGVKEARNLRRQHCRVVMGNGKSKTLSEVFPETKPLALKIENDMSP
ncbi:MAG: FMN-binding glutamate synthase family protein [Rhodospirillaceae bacterium]|nr:FMN-binding glutamate synthase family protein [Rhodospirillaceae bacterium]